MSARSARGDRTSSAVVRDAHARRVLQRHERARVDRLTLREQERMHPAARLRRRQPLQRRRRRRRPVANAQARRPVERDAQPRAEDRLRRPQLPAQRPPAAVVDALDGELPRVEIDHARAAVAARGRRTQPQLRGARQRPAQKVHVDVPRQMLDGRLRVVGHRMRIPPHRRTSHILIARASTNSLPLKIGRPPYAPRNTSGMKFNVPDAPTEKSNGPTLTALRV